jgi:hypothetical protein
MATLGRIVCIYANNLINNLTTTGKIIMAEKVA